VLSCSSAGNCAVAGRYTDAQGNARFFVADEKNGTWGTARTLSNSKVPGQITGVSSISCASPGNCALTGSYHRGDNDTQQAFVAEEKNGTWAPAVTVPGSDGLNIGGNAAGQSISCTTAGNCAVAGDFTDVNDILHAMVADEKNGAWGQAHDLPVTDAPGGTDPVASSVSCSSPGNCAATGSYFRVNGDHAFVADEANGTWGQAREITLGPGTSDAVAEDVSCPAPGACALTGDYLDGDGRRQAFVAEEANGTWNPNTVQALPGVASLNTGGEYVNSADHPLPSLPFLAEQSPATSSALALSAASVRSGHEQAEKLTVTVKPRTAGTPSGTVTIKAASTTLCTVTLNAGQAACTLRSSQLRPGTYQLTATYNGSDVYDHSTFASHKLTVAK